VSTSSTRSRLVAAAYELLIEEAAEAPTIQDVARRAGLTNGAVYANFASRHELLREVALACWSNRPQARLARLATGRDPVGDVELDGLIALLAEQQSAPPGPEYRLLAEVTGEAMRNPDTERILRACVSRLGSAAAASTERASTERAAPGGTVDARASTDALAGVIVDLYLGAITAKSLNRRQPPEEDMLAVLRILLAPDPS
jgi:AcrR family transcriptional regulator